jgi:transcriptional regulator with XRE-family HTH domain
MKTMARTIAATDLKSWRKRRGYTQADVAKRFGMTQQSYAYLEREGANQLHAMAIAAIEHGLEPWSPPPSPEAEGSSHDEQQHRPQA